MPADRRASRVLPHTGLYACDHSGKSKNTDARSAIYPDAAAPVRSAYAARNRGRRTGSSIVRNRLKGHADSLEIQFIFIDDTQCTHSSSQSNIANRIPTLPNKAISFDPF
ncbi:hypothetical protein WS68_12445 [Burkholderia sp. TSV86]|nr:hypothetical protein WS68_12445 [Burkholderia sp. TSV86]